VVPARSQSVVHGIGPSSAWHGTDVMVYLNFTAGAAGTATLNLTRGLFSRSPDSNPMYAACLEHGTITINAPGTVAGAVILQGRDYPGHSTRNGGATIVLVRPGVSLSTVSERPGGGFAFPSVPPLPDYEARASMDGYLTAVKADVDIASGEAKNLDTVKLLGGDATHDQMINVQDLAFIGSRFNKPYGSWSGNDSWADINADNAINILDLTLAGSNFGKAAPQDWTA
jgi:hypothetical protein